MTSIHDAIQGAGGPAKVARALGVTVQAVCFWRDGLRSLPAEHCPTLERLNDGRVRCEELRPDVDWAYLRRQPTPAEQGV
ncbi:helix-turn-helix domain-containing protein [Comamonadaceae bacterium PP-2]